MQIKKIVLTSLTIMSLLIFKNALCAVDATSGKTAATSKYSLSFDQIKMAAQSGDADAQYALGYMFYYGKSGAPKDVSLAKTWIGKAAAQKQPQAVKAIALMNAKQSQLAPEQKMVASTQNVVNERQSENSATIDTERKAVDTKSNEKMSLVDMNNQKIEDKKMQEDSQVTTSVSGDALYTLQLLGASNKDQIKKLVREHHLAKAKMYKTTFKNKDWYVLIYGQYKTKSEANSAAKRIEGELAVKPWVKPLASVKRYKLTAAS